MTGISTTIPKANLKSLVKPELLMVILLAFWAAIIASGNAIGARALEPSQLATDWYDLQLQLVQETPGFTPPVAARAFGYTGVTLYESIVPGMDGYQSLAGQLNELHTLPQPQAGQVYHWPTVANSALATINTYLFPTASVENLAAIDTLYATYARQFALETESDVIERSAAQGRAVADAIYAWSLTDGGHEGYLRNFPADFAPPAGDGLWTPTPRYQGDPLPALQPFWGNNRPFVLTAGDECAPPDPTAYAENPDSPFYLEAFEVFNTVVSRTPEQETIARFWSDDPGTTATPGGHSISILTQVLRQEQATLDEAAEAYAKLGIALADAFIGCWNIKYQYNLLRPVTYIQSLMDAAWMPILDTPPFPEFPSGHSVQSGAAAAVLTDLFGENYTFADHTHDARGFEARTFHSFAEFAQEAAMSRLYGGIHYRPAIEMGIAQGECIGARVNTLVFRSA